MALRSRSYFESSTFTRTILEAMWTCYTFCNARPVSKVLRKCFITFWGVASPNNTKKFIFLKMRILLPSSNSYQNLSRTYCSMLLNFFTFQNFYGLDMDCRPRLLPLAIRMLHNRHKIHARAWYKCNAVRTVIALHPTYKYLNNCCRPPGIKNFETKLLNFQILSCRLISRPSCTQ